MYFCFQVLSKTCTAPFERSLHRLRLYLSATTIFVKSHRTESIEVRGLNVKYLIRFTYRKMPGILSGYGDFVGDNLKQQFSWNTYTFWTQCTYVDNSKCVKIFQNSATRWFFVYKTTKFAASEARENLNSLNVNKRIKFLTFWILDSKLSSWWDFIKLLHQNLKKSWIL